MIQVEPKHKKIITDILSKYPFTFYAFGSRVSGKPQRFSDLDLCFFDEISDKEYLNIEEDFENSDLPYKVDLINGNKCDEDFRDMIRQNMVRFYEK